LKISIKVSEKLSASILTDLRIVSRRRHRALVVINYQTKRRQNTVVLIINGNENMKS
jgi:hypothetical protein